MNNKRLASSWLASREGKHRTNLSALASRFVLFLLLWWILVTGSSESLWLGIPTSIIMALLSLSVFPPSSFSLPAFFRFVPFFVWHSLRGGIDVGRRAFQPALPITPELLEYSMRLPHGVARVFFSNIVNLLPGTLSTGFDGDVLQVHVLDHSGRHLEEITIIENRIARIFNGNQAASQKGRP